MSVGRIITVDVHPSRKTLGKVTITDVTNGLVVAEDVTEAAAVAAVMAKWGVAVIGPNGLDQGLVEKSVARGKEHGCQFGVYGAAIDDVKNIALGSV